jgi:hypothetical protein
MILGGRDQADKPTQADADPGCAAVAEASDRPQPD